MTTREAIASKNIEHLTISAEFSLVSANTLSNKRSLNLIIDLDLDTIPQVSTPLKLT